MKKLSVIVFMWLAAIGCTADAVSNTPPTATHTLTPTVTVTPTIVDTETPIVTVTPTITVTPTYTPEPTLCPQATPEQLLVDSVVSPTGLLTQTIVVRAGRSEWVEVDTGYDVFTATGDFNAFGKPAEIEISLVPGEIHQLTVKSRVKVVEQGDCAYGGYTLTARSDRDGNPLEILQEAD